MTPDQAIEREAGSATSDAIDKVARAIYERAATHGPPGPPAWDDANNEIRDWIRGHAIAALRAIREPTEEMVKVGNRYAENPSLPGAFERAFQAAIDKALET